MNSSFKGRRARKGTHSTQAGLRGTAMSQVTKPTPPKEPGGRGIATACARRSGHSPHSRNPFQVDGPERTDALTGPGGEGGGGEEEVVATHGAKYNWPSASGPGVGRDGRPHERLVFQKGVIPH